jgi:hypothetical protein
VLILRSYPSLVSTASAAAVTSIVVIETSFFGPATTTLLVASGDGFGAALGAVKRTCGLFEGMGSCDEQIRE